MGKVLIIVDTNLLTRIDEHIDKAGGYGKNRSAFIREACEYYLTIKHGISNKIRKRQLDEMD